MTVFIVNKASASFFRLTTPDPKYIVQRYIIVNESAASITSCIVPTNAYFFGNTFTYTLGGSMGTPAKKCYEFQYIGPYYLNTPTFLALPGP